MTAATVPFGPPLPPNYQWKMLVERSVTTWPTLQYQQPENAELYTKDQFIQLKDTLQTYTSLDEFLGDKHANMFWFFYLRKSFETQKAMPKWDVDKLQDYILLPAEHGYISRDECFFFSHFWHYVDHPDPTGKDFRRLQRQLAPESWLFIWIDWTCLPQGERTPSQETYYVRCQKGNSAIVRETTFDWVYASFKADLRVLHDVTHSILTSSRVDFVRDPVYRIYEKHMKEMMSSGVDQVISKYGYSCGTDSNRALLIANLDFLILIEKLEKDIMYRRHMLDLVTWNGNPGIGLLDNHGGYTIQQYEGKLKFHGVEYRFTPFPLIDGLQCHECRNDTCRSKSRIF